MTGWEEHPRPCHSERSAATRNLLLKAEEKQLGASRCPFCRQFHLWNLTSTKISILFDWRTETCLLHLCKRLKGRGLIYPISNVSVGDQIAFYITSWGQLVLSRWATCVPEMERRFFQFKRLWPVIPRPERKDKYRKSCILRIRFLAILRITGSQTCLFTMCAPWIHKSSLLTALG
jgi:hypothetical protein